MSATRKAEDKEGVTNLWSIWKFCDRSAARLTVGDEPRVVLSLRKSGRAAGFLNERSKKLGAPKPDMPEKGGKTGDGSGSKQWPKSIEGGCMAANGEDCSIAR